MKKMKITKKIMAVFALFALAVGSFAVSLNQSKVASAATPWDVSGNYVINMNYLGTDYPHDMSLSQNGTGNLTGNGGSPAGANTYTWVITSGSIEDTDVSFDADYTATPDAVTPQTVLHVEGVIAGDGTISGTWSDNYQGGVRAGTWTTTSGAAIALPGTLAAEDFGVMDMSGVKGYTAGFGLTDATFENAQSVIVKLYSGAILLQTNTLNGPNAASITGVQISSPFDVFGTFDYVADVYWENVREAEYGQNLIPDKVVATVVLENGKEVTAENTNLTGDPETIFPPEDEDPEMVKVTIKKYVDGALATGTSANNADFTMNAAWDAENIGAGSGQYTLSENGFGGDPTPYQAITADMTSGADYSTSEVMDSVVAASCDTDAPFSLVGYAVGDTLAEAEAATPTLVAPSFTNLTTDKFVLVLNDDCATDADGTIGGEVVGGVGVLEVTSVETVDSTATADDTFENGWEYVFNITVPTNEDDLAMKFADWARTGGGGTIPAANNIRISSPQADNSGATVLITAANTYSTPALHMTGDLNPSMDGLQVKVTVEVKIPSDTPSGSYTTSYGVKTE